MAYGPRGLLFMTFKNVSPPQIELDWTCGAEKERKRNTAYSTMANKTNKSSDQGEAF